MKESLAHFLLGLVGAALILTFEPALLVLGFCLLCAGVVLATVSFYRTLNRELIKPLELVTALATTGKELKYKFLFAFRRLPGFVQTARILRRTERTVPDVKKLRRYLIFTMAFALVFSIIISVFRGILVGALVFILSAACIMHSYISIRKKQAILFEKSD